MAWIPKWIWKREEQDPEHPDVRFGRQYLEYTTDINARYWESSLGSFEQGSYLDGVQHLLQFLSAPNEDNVRWNRDEKGIRFSIRQGSKEIFGEADARRIRIEGPVAQVQEGAVGLWRKMLELNYQLNYGRYALDEHNHICLRFDSFCLDCSPYKLFAALKEVALNADKEDDLMIEDFPGLSPVNNQHIRELSEREKKAKLILLRTRIRECLDSMKDPSLNASVHTGGIAYILLDTIYRLDYLTRPEGRTMVTFEEIQKSFFSGEAQATTDKIRASIRLLEKLNDRSDEDFLKELYFVPRTFSVLDKASLDVIRGLWIAESGHIDWYIENKIYRIARAIVGYALGYSIFNYILPPVIMELIHFYYRIEEGEYFTALGFHENTGSRKGEKGPLPTIRKILERHDSDPGLTGMLDMTNEALFSRSFLNMLIKMTES